MLPYSHILSTVVSSPWAIYPPGFDVVASILARHIAGEPPSDEALAQVAAAQQERRRSRSTGVVATLPLHGVIIPRADLIAESSGATSCESFTRAFEALVDDDEVAAIVLDVNSPGGSVHGVTELADRMWARRGEKPVVAVSNHLMGSAAYFIACQADEVVASPSSVTGSIGVYDVHASMARALDAQGIDVTLIRAGEFKAEGLPFFELGEEAADHLQSSINVYYDQFVKAVARGRGVSASAVRSGFGEGRALTAEAALNENLVDLVETLPDVIARLSTTRGRNKVLDRRASAGDETVVALQLSPTDAAALAEGGTLRMGGDGAIVIEERPVPRAEATPAADEAAEIAAGIARGMEEIVHGPHSH